MSNSNSFKETNSKKKRIFKQTTGIVLALSLGLGTLMPSISYAKSDNTPSNRTYTLPTDQLLLNSIVNSRGIDGHFPELRARYFTYLPIGLEYNEYNVGTAAGEAADIIFKDYDYGMIANSTNNIGEWYIFIDSIHASMLNVIELEKLEIRYDNNIKIQEAITPELVGSSNFKSIVEEKLQSATFMERLYRQLDYDIDSSLEFSYGELQDGKIDIHVYFNSVGVHQYVGKVTFSGGQIDTTVAPILGRYDIYTYLEFKNGVITDPKLLREMDQLIREDWIVTDYMEKLPAGAKISFVGSTALDRKVNVEVFVTLDGETTRVGELVVYGKLYVDLDKIISDISNKTFKVYKNDDPYEIRTEINNTIDSLYPELFYSKYTFVVIVEEDEEPSEKSYFYRFTQYPTSFEKRIPVNVIEEIFDISNYKVQSVKNNELDVYTKHNDLDKVLAEVESSLSRDRNILEKEGYQLSIRFAKDSITKVELVATEANTDAFTDDLNNKLESKIIATITINYLNSTPSDDENGDSNNDPVIPTPPLEEEKPAPTPPSNGGNDSEDDALEKPDTDKPSTDIPVEKPDTDKPSTDIPVEKPDTDKPGTDIPVEKPDTDKPSTDVPVEKPDTDKPSTNIPVEKPETDKPSEDKPSTDQPVEEPSIEKDPNEQLDAVVEVIESGKKLTLKGETTVSEDGNKVSKYGITSEVVNQLKNTTKEIVLTDGTSGTSIVLNNESLDIDSLKAKLGSDMSLQVSVVATPYNTFRLEITAIGKDSKVDVTEFKSQVKVTFELQPTAKALALSSEKTADVLFQVIDGKLVHVPHKIGGNKVTVRTYESGEFEIATVSASFKDIDNYFSKDRILDLAVRGIVNGVDNQTFEPTSQMSRAEFATMVARALGLKSSEENPFYDVSTDKWYTESILALAEAGIVQGSGNGYFNPNEKISREEVATILSRIIDLELGKSLSAIMYEYSDSDKISDYAKIAVLNLSSYGIFSGYPDGSFAPKKKMTRGEMAKVLTEVLKVIDLM